MVPNRMASNSLTEVSGICRRRPASDIVWNRPKPIADEHSTWDESPRTPAKKACRNKPQLDELRPVYVGLCRYCAKYSATQSCSPAPVSSGNRKLIEFYQSAPTYQQLILLSCGISRMWLKLNHRISATAHGGGGGGGGGRLRKSRGLHYTRWIILKMSDKAPSTSIIAGKRPVRFAPSNCR